jgi:hypothetical protein
MERIASAIHLAAEKKVTTRCAFTKSTRAKIIAASIFVEPVLTTGSVIAVMPACLLPVPNPGSRNEWSADCDSGIHYVWPFKLGAGLVLVVVSRIAGHISHEQNEAMKQLY